MWDRMSEWWCKKIHSGAMWPVHGKYVCPTCLREYPVLWESLPTHAEYSQAAPQRVQPTGRSVLWARLTWHQLVGSLKRFDTM